MASGNYRELKVTEKIVVEALGNLDKVSLTGLLCYTHTFSKEINDAQNAINSAKEILQNIVLDLNAMP